MKYQELIPGEGVSLRASDEPRRFELKFSDGAAATVTLPLGGELWIEAGKEPVTVRELGLRIIRREV